jgi:SAM-dependent methyltransferase
MSELTLPSETDVVPDPGPELISRVAGGPDRDAFFQSGRDSVRELERTLAIAGRSLDSFESILDFGCGCGRMLLWMEHLGRARALHGTDIDAEAVAWCQANLPFATVGVNQAEPPLPYPNATFDLVFNHSVFTHIDERRQDLWLTELQRVTRSDGLLVLSTHGEVALPADSCEIRDDLESHGIVFLDRSVPRDFPLPDWYQTTLHAPWYVFEHWGQWFEILAYVPGGSLGLQDHILLKRRPGSAQPHRPIAARPLMTAPVAPETRVLAALASARSYRGESTRGSRYGALGDIARRLVLRALRPYTAHEDRFDTAVATSITELTRSSDHYRSQIAALEKRLGEAD